MPKLTRVQQLIMDKAERSGSIVAGNHTQGPSLRFMVRVATLAALVSAGLLVRLEYVRGVPVWHPVRF